MMYGWLRRLLHQPETVYVRCALWEVAPMTPRDPHQELARPDVPPSWSPDLIDYLRTTAQKYLSHTDRAVRDMALALDQVCHERPNR